MFFAVERIRTHVVLVVGAFVFAPAAHLPGPIRDMEFESPAGTFLALVAVGVGAVVIEQFVAANTKMFFRLQSATGGGGGGLTIKTTPDGLTVLELAIQLNCRPSN